VNGSGQRATAQPLLEADAFEQLHRQKHPPVDLFDLVNRADARMVERGRGPRFALETVDRRAVARERLRQELQRDGAPELDVERLEDHTHPAAADLLENLIMRDGFADHHSAAACASMRRVRQKGRSSHRRSIP
jgi:hypothetical protein